MPLRDVLNEIEGVIWGRRNISVKFTGTTSADNVSTGRNDDFVDLWVSERHEIKVKTTRYPIESGGVVTDNAYVDPRKLTLTGYISNIQNVDFTAGIFSYESPQKIKSGWATLEQAARNLELLNINTTIGEFSNMLITGLSTSIDKSTGTNLLFRLDFTEIKTASSSVSEIVNKNVDGSNNPAKNMTDKVKGGTVQSNNTSLIRSWLGG